MGSPPLTPYTVPPCGVGDMAGVRVLCPSIPLCRPVPVPSIPLLRVSAQPKPGLTSALSLLTSSPVKKGLNAKLFDS